MYIQLGKQCGVIAPIIHLASHFCVMLEETECQRAVNKAVC